MILGGSLIFVVFIGKFVKYFSLHLIIKGGFGMNIDIGYVVLFLFSYI